MIKLTYTTAATVVYVGAAKSILMVVVCLCVHARLSAPSCLCTVAYAKCGCVYFSIRV